MTDDPLVAELRIVAETAFPPTPSLVENVMGGIATTRRRPSRLATIAAVAAVLVAAVLVLPGPRAAVARLIGIGGVTIEQVAAIDMPPATQTGTALGAETELDEVAGIIGFTPALPSVDGLDDPVVYVRTDVADGLVSLVYATPDDAVGLIITQFEAIGEVAIKQLGGDATFREVQLAPDVRGFWIEGGPHTISFLGPDGTLREDTARLVGDTLVWQAGDRTFRIESEMPLDAVLDIARSLMDTAPR